MTDLTPDEAFEASTHYCTRGHARREMVETRRRPDDPWTRRLECPACDHAFWVTIDPEADESRYRQVD